MREVHHTLRGSWHSSERSLRALSYCLQQKGAGPGVRLRFEGKAVRVKDAVTLVDLAGLLGVDEVWLPSVRGTTAERLAARADFWSLRVAVKVE